MERSSYPTQSYIPTVPSTVVKENNFNWNKENKNLVSNIFLSLGVLFASATILAGCAFLAVPLTTTHVATTAVLGIVAMAFLVAGFFSRRNSEKASVIKNDELIGDLGSVKEDEKKIPKLRNGNTGSQYFFNKEDILTQNLGLIEKNLEISARNLIEKTVPPNIFLVNHALELVPVGPMKLPLILQEPSCDLRIEAIIKKNRLLFQKVGVILEKNEPLDRPQHILQKLSCDFIVKAILKKNELLFQKHRPVFKLYRFYDAKEPPSALTRANFVSTKMNRLALIKSQNLLPKPFDCEIRGPLALSTYGPSGWQFVVPNIVIQKTKQFLFRDFVEFDVLNDRDFSSIQCFREGPVANFSIKNLNTNKMQKFQLTLPKNFEFNQGLVANQKPENQKVLALCDSNQKKAPSEDNVQEPNAPVPNPQNTFEQVVAAEKVAVEPEGYLQYLGKQVGAYATKENAMAAIGIIALFARALSEKPDQPVSDVKPEDRSNLNGAGSKAKRDQNSMLPQPVNLAEIVPVEHNLLPLNHKAEVTHKPARPNKTEILPGQPGYVEQQKRLAELIVYNDPRATS